MNDDRSQHGETHWVIGKLAARFVQHRVAAELMPVGAELSLHTIRGIPLYDGDAESAEGIPQTVTDLKEAIAAADGLLLVTSEYNNSMSGVLKNAIDWLSRPTADIRRVFGGKPVALMRVSASGFGTLLSNHIPNYRSLMTSYFAKTKGKAK